MRHASSAVSLQPPALSIDSLGPSANRRVGSRADGRAVESQNFGPLLDGLLVVLVVENLIAGSVEQLQLRPPPVVPRVRSLDLGCPLGRGLDHASLRTVAVPVSVDAGVVGGSEAGERHASKGGTGGENIRVRAQQHLRHHRSGGYAGDEDTLGISVILVQSPLDHADDALGITAPVVGQRLLGRDIPALVGRVRRVGIDDDEAVLGGEGGVLRAGVGCFSGAMAPMGVDENGWIGWEDVRDVDVEADVAGVGAKVLGDLDQGGSRGERGQITQEQVFESHVAGFFFFFLGARGAYCLNLGCGF